MDHRGREIRSFWCRTTWNLRQKRRRRTTKKSVNCGQRPLLCHESVERRREETVITCSASQESAGTSLTAKESFLWFHPSSSLAPMQTGQRRWQLSRPTTTGHNNEMSSLQIMEGHYTTMYVSTLHTMYTHQCIKLPFSCQCTPLLPTMGRI